MWGPPVSQSHDMSGSSICDLKCSGFRRYQNPKARSFSGFNRRLSSGGGGSRTIDLGLILGAMKLGLGQHTVPCRPWGCLARKPRPPRFIQSPGPISHHNDRSYPHRIIAGRRHCIARRRRRCVALGAPCATSGLGHLCPPSSGPARCRQKRNRA